MGFMSKGMKSLVKNNKFNASLTAAMLPMSIDEYEQKRADGHGALTSGAAVTFDNALMMALNMKGALGYGLLASAGDIYEGVYQANNYGRQLNASKYAHAFDSAQFNDTEQVHTMREAGMNMLQRSKYNTQMALMGNEAKYMYK